MGAVLTEPTELSVSSPTLEFEDKSSFWILISTLHLEDLQALCGIYFKSLSFWLRPCFVCEYTVGTSTRLSWNQAIPLELYELLVHFLLDWAVSTETVTSHWSDSFWNQAVPLELCQSAFGLTHLEEGCSTGTVLFSLLVQFLLELHCSYWNYAFQPLVWIFEIGQFLVELCWHLAYKLFRLLL